MQTIFPLLRYDDARSAIRWLCATFGFVELFSVPESGMVVRHARLELGESQIMLGSVRPDDGMTSPQTLGAATQALCVYVDDVDAHFERARAAGATIEHPPQDNGFGAREYHVQDLEGHPWVFSQHVCKPATLSTAPRARRVTLALYAVFGTLAVVLGIAALLMPALAVPAEDYSPVTAHLIREGGALGVFVGLMAFWTLTHFEQRRPVHFALLLFTALFAAIHWADYIADQRSLLSPVFNSIPFLAFAVTAPIGRCQR